MRLPWATQITLALCAAAGALLFPQDALAQAQDLTSLEKEVEGLRDRSLWDAALEAVRKYSEAHPSEAGDIRVKRLLLTTTELAREAETLFKKAMGEAQTHLVEGKTGPAIAAASKALAWYPEKAGSVKEFQDRALKLRAGQNLVRIAAGRCRIGSDRPQDENPRREVSLKGFLIDRYPVTNEDYLAFVSATSRPAPTHWQNSKPPKGRELHPVVLVSWEDAQAYARWAGKRLPTSEEWEVAAAGPEAREFPWGRAATEKEEAYPCNCLEYWQVHKTQSPGTLPVDFFDKLRPDQPGGLSMGGNVWEWTLSPAPGKVGDAPREFHVLKGGSFMMPIRTVRCAQNYAENPRLTHPDVGFRCAKDVD